MAEGLTMGASIFSKFLFSNHIVS